MEDQEGTTTLRITNHMKKFIQQDPCLETLEGNEYTNPQSIDAEQSTEIILCQVPPQSPEDSSSKHSSLHPLCIRHPPAWMKDYRCVFLRASR